MRGAERHYSTAAERIIHGRWSGKTKPQLHAFTIRQMHQPRIANRVLRLAEQDQPFAKPKLRLPRPVPRNPPLRIRQREIPPPWNKPHHLRIREPRMRCLRIAYFKRAKEEAGRFDGGSHSVLPKPLCTPPQTSGIRAEGIIVRGKN